MNDQNRKFFDSACEKLLKHDVHDGMTELSLALRDVRNKLDQKEWETFSSKVIRHRIQQILHEDPFTRHAFLKPRGYPGDALLLDYMYGHKPPPEETSILGRAIFDYTTNTGFPLSVRSRRDILASAIDDTADRFASPKIVSVACGHLREAMISVAISTKRVTEFVALDQDQESLGHIAETYPNQNVRTLNASVRAIISRAVRLNGFHLAYAAGLYDYLVDRVATKLTTAMFEMLASGGRLLIANFAPSGRDIAYMETFMGWKLIYRNENDMNRLTSGIAPESILSQRLFWDEHKNVIYLEVEKK